MAGVDLKIAQVSDDTPLDSTITASGTAGESEATVSITLPDGQSGTDPDLYFYLEKDGQAYAGEDFEASIKLEDGLLKVQFEDDGDWLKLKTPDDITTLMIYSRLCEIMSSIFLTRV